MSTPNVLIVDDERNIRLTLSATLEAFSIASDTAGSGNQALQKLAEKSFQLMLLDLKLPDLDGLEVLRLVTDKYPDLKVIIMTAYGSIEAAVEAMKTGALDFLQKPLEPNVVHNVVRPHPARTSGRSTGLEIRILYRYGEAEHYGRGV